jgi:hypothetical protein
MLNVALCINSKPKSAKEYQKNKFKVSPKEKEINASSVCVTT